jgi:DNA-binding MarR family transcriptional regulator
VSELSVPRRASRPDEQSELGVELADAVSAFRRVTRRVVRPRVPGPELPPSEGELLAFVARSKGAGVGEAAQALQLAPNTVSTLVTRLSRAGLLARRADPSDRRAARLQLTVAGHARVRRYRRQRADVLQTALHALDGDQRAALAAALPALRRLTASLEELAEPTRSGGSDHGR